MTGVAGLALVEGTTYACVHSTKYVVIRDAAEDLPLWGPVGLHGGNSSPVIADLDPESTGGPNPITDPWPVSPAVWRQLTGGWGTDIANSSVALGDVNPATDTLHIPDAVVGSDSSKLWSFTGNG